MSSTQEDINESAKQSNNAGTSQQTEAAAQNEMDAAANAAMEKVKDALQPLVQFLSDCSEGAIEGHGDGVAEKVCAAATNAIGAEGARLLGEGASDIVNGQTAQGVDKIARAAEDLAKQMMELRESFASGTFYRDLAGEMAKQAAAQWLGDETRKR
jgi:hypothetical protein